MIIDAALGHTDDPRPVLVRAGLHDERVVEALQDVLARIWGVVDRRVVAAEDQLDALQTHHSIGLGPAAVVADHHPDEPAERRPHAESVRPRLEEVALGVLERAVRLVILVARQVHLAVPGDDGTVALDEDLRVVPVAPAVDRVRLGQLGVPQAEADAEPPGIVEQRLRLRPRHRPLVVVVELGDVVDEPAGEERRQRQLGEHDELAATLVAGAQKHPQPFHYIAARMITLDRPELGTTDRQHAGHQRMFARRCRTLIAPAVVAR
jgi:hypothetical protein